MTDYLEKLALRLSMKRHRRIFQVTAEIIQDERVMRASPARVYAAFVDAEACRRRRKKRGLSLILLGGLPKLQQILPHAICGIQVGAMAALGYFNQGEVILALHFRKCWAQSRIY